LSSLESAKIFVPFFDHSEKFGSKFKDRKRMMTLGPMENPMMMGTNRRGHCNLGGITTNGQDIIDSGPSLM
jgi:hypothetical protein